MQLWPIPVLLSIRRNSTKVVQLPAGPLVAVITALLGLGLLRRGQLTTLLMTFAGSSVKPCRPITPSLI